MGTVDLMSSYTPSIMTNRLVGFKRSNGVELDSDDRCAKSQTQLQSFESLANGGLPTLLYYFRFGI